jgi:hypothetical protein
LKKEIGKNVEVLYKKVEIEFEDDVIRYEGSG